MNLPEDIAYIFIGTVDKYIDFNKEEKEISPEQKQEILKNNEQKDGSFFGLMLEG